MILRDQIVVLVGVGPGMGSQLAQLAAREGAKVVLVARSAGFLEQVAAQIRANGGSCLVAPADVTQQEQCRSVVEKTLQSYGRIDGLVNAAYCYDPPQPVERVDMDAAASSLDVILLSALRMTQEVAPCMKAQGSGSIVNVSSVIARMPTGHDPVFYTMGKGGLAALTRHLAVELGPFGIRVNTVAPGWMWGKPLEDSFNQVQATTGVSVQAQIDAVAARIPLRRIPTDEDCARTVLFFLSGYSCAVTGASLDVNGGQWMAP